jgi:excisionase family DNA binding protein
MQGMQKEQAQSSTVQRLLTARQVQEFLGIDRSTIYRMADDGRLPAIRVGKQWRFSRDDILALVSAMAHPTDASRVPLARTSADVIDRTVATVATAVGADLLGVMMVVTDMAGQPLTEVANPCEWFIRNSADDEAMRACTTEWRGLADAHDFTPTFRSGPVGFECARSFIRSGRELVGMVLAGGVCAPGESSPDLYTLNAAERAAVLRALPRIASVISSQISPVTDESMEEAR